MGNVFYAFKFRKTIIQLDAVFECENQFEALNLCERERKRVSVYILYTLSSAAHVLAIISTILRA